MASIKNFFRPSNKRPRQFSSESEQSSSSSKSPPAKKTVCNNDSIDSNDSFVKYMANLEDQSDKMEFLKNHFDEDKDTPDWAKLMYGKLCALDSKFDESRTILESIIAGMELIEHRLGKVIIESKESAKKISDVSTEVQQLKTQNISLQAKITKLEDYSKHKYNIKIFNVEDKFNESPSELRAKFEDVLCGMELNIEDIYIDNLHRLPARGKGPRPIIVKFVSALDKNLVWSRTNRLAHTNIQFREHFSVETEENIKTLLPVRRAALDQQMKVKLVADKLYINNNKYDVNNLDKLPTSLQNARFGCKVIQDKLFFFTSASPLSNFHMSGFTVNGLNYSCGEQFIQWKKAMLFKCENIANEIMTTTNPGNMKWLGRKVLNFDQKKWREAIPDITKTCLENKFEQNHDLRHYLVNTKPNKLYEASPKDNLWGIGCSIGDPNLLNKQKEWGQNILGTALVTLRTGFNS